jgi:hypothetical protein
MYCCEKFWYGTIVLVAEERRSKQKTPLLQLARTIEQAAETFGHYFPQARLQNPLISLVRARCKQRAGVQEFTASIRFVG